MRTRRAAAWALAVFLLLSGCAPAPAAGHSAAPDQDLPSPAVAVTPPPGLFPSGFPLILQKPELPNGCEITSLAMLLCQAGYDADKVELAERYLPRADFTEANGVRLGPDPDRDYAGDPATDGGWYCFEGPILAAANRYLSERGGGRLAVSLTGLDLRGLRAYLDAGTPLAVWVTIGYAEPNVNAYSWRLPDGSDYYPCTNLHCVVLAGRDGGDFIVADPLNGWRRVPAEILMPSFEAMGRRAVALLKAG